MTHAVSMAQLKSHLSETIGEVQHTRCQVIIEKHGKPVAMLVPMPGARPEGLLGLVGAFDDAPGFADAVDDAIRARRSDRRRKVPRLG